jgi:hypothetical protein
MGDIRKFFTVSFSVRWDIAISRLSPTVKTLSDDKKSHDVFVSIFTFLN